MFHGAKTALIGELSLTKSRRNNDFGQGFYCGESIEQSAMFVTNFSESSLYILDFNPENLKCLKLDVEQSWILLIAYFRGRLKEYGKHPLIQNLLAGLVGIDYIVAPIANNRMFQIADSFIDGEITDVQCRHCLLATHLGAKTQRLARTK